MEEKDFGSYEDAVELLPFLEFFPYDDYEIGIEYGIKANLNPLLYTIFKAESEDKIFFRFTEGEFSLSISIYVPEVEWVRDIGPGIKKVDALSLELQQSLDSHDIIKKVGSIKKGRTFTKSFKNSELNAPDFHRLAVDLCEISETSLPTEILSEMQALRFSEATLGAKLDKSQSEVVLAYLNFHLHYFRIALGLTIASKIC